MVWKKTLLQDVARKAGVSTATVSRTLSKPEVVSDATRNTVFEAVRSTGYAINHAARNLRRARTDCIVALIPNLANPFFAQILSGISSVLAPAGYNLLISDTQGSPDAERLMMSYLDHGRADGLILLDGLIPVDHLMDATRARPLPPSVLACEWIEAVPLPRIRVDNAQGAHLAVTHLIGLGHRRIGHLRGPEGNVLTVAREAGHRAAMAAAGLDFDESWLLSGDFSLGSGAVAAARWLDMDRPPTAVFCASDAMAAGFISAVQRAGKSVPDDCSVVGFDDIEVAAHIMPALTTIRQPRTQIGQVAARTLLALIANGHADVEDHILPVEFVLRDSTARPRG